MEVRNFRARSLQEALRLVREELGPEAAVLHTRELRPTLWGLWGGTRQVEVSASLDVHVPSRFVDHARAEPVPGKPGPLAGASLADEGRAAEGRPAVPPADAHDYRGQFRDDLKDQLAGLQSLVEQLCRQSTEARIGSCRRFCCAFSLT